MKNSSADTGQKLLFVAGCAGIGVVVLNYYLNKKTADKINQINNDVAFDRLQTITVQPVNRQTGRPEGNPIQINLKAIALQINEAFHGNWFTDDEDGAIAALRKVPVAYIPQLDKLYRTITDKSLQSDFLKYLSSDQYAGIANYFNV